MQRIFTLLVAGIFVSGNLFAQNKHMELGIGYNAAVPLGAMQQSSNTVHAVSLQGMYLFPLKRLAAGIELNAGSYASFTRQQEFGFNGTQTMTDVHYNSNVTTGLLAVRYSFFQFSNYEVFATMKGGMANYSSQLQIEDPEDPDGCHPLETRNLIDDYTWTAGGRAGVNVDMKAFAKKMRANTILIQAYGGFMAGGDVDYINVKNTMEDDGTHHHTTTDANGRPVEMEFVNVSTGQTHQHEVARVYTNPMRYAEAGITFVFRF